jgi:hypothetical protein
MAFCVLLLHAPIQMQRRHVFSAFLGGIQSTRFSRNAFSSQPVITTSGTTHSRQRRGPGRWG